MTFGLINKATTIFWDFDGVIKDSVLVKSNAFEKLFINFGDELVKKIIKHHEENGGMSRYEKLPIYISWSGEQLSNELVKKYEKKFSQLVKKKVINSPWVEGAFEYLSKNHKRQMFFLITATPQKEVEEILKELKIDSYFKEVIGSPINKKEALQKLLIKYNINISNSIMIGDSNSDYEAAKVNKINFIIRKTALNKKLQETSKCPMIENFSNG